MKKDFNLSRFFFYLKDLLGQVMPIIVEKWIYLYEYFLNTFKNVSTYLAKKNFMKFLPGKKPKVSQKPIDQVINDFEYVSKNKPTELLEYYKVLREMLKNFNNMILDISLKGGTLILALVAASYYLPKLQNKPLDFFSVLFIYGAVLMCKNLQGQLEFFTGMLRKIIGVTKNVEALLFSTKQGANISIPSEILITTVLERDFPGKKFIRRREWFFPKLRLFLWVYLIYTVYVVYPNILNEVLENLFATWKEIKEFSY